MGLRYVCHCVWPLPLSLPSYFLPVVLIFLLHALRPWSTSCVLDCLLLHYSDFAPITLDEPPSLLVVLGTYVSFCTTSAHRDCRSRACAPTQKKTLTVLNMFWLLCYFFLRNWSFSGQTRRRDAEIITYKRHFPSAINPPLSH